MLFLCLILCFHLLIILLVCLFKIGFVLILLSFISSCQTLWLCLHPVRLFTVCYGRGKLGSRCSVGLVSEGDVFSLPSPCVSSGIWKCTSDERPCLCVVSEVTYESLGLQLQFH